MAEMTSLPKKSQINHEELDLPVFPYPLNFDWKRINSVLRLLHQTICSPERILEYTYTHIHHVYFKMMPEISLEEKSSLIPFTKICGFHQIIDRFSQPCTTVGKTQLLSVYLQLLLADKNGFTTLQYVRSDRIYPSPVCLHSYFQMRHLSLILIFLIEVTLVIFKGRLFRYHFLSLLNV